MAARLPKERKPTVIDAFPLPSRRRAAKTLAGGIGWKRAKDAHETRLELGGIGVEKMIELIGFMAAMCTTVSFIPQAMKTIRTKDTSSISLWMYVMFSVGVFLWLAYGLAIGNYPIIIANMVTFVLAATILWFKLKYK
jgi:MtN3 and saliva related transmembrane protein